MIIIEIKTQSNPNKVKKSQYIVESGLKKVFQEFEVYLFVT